MKKNKTKKAMSLLSILAMMIVVMVAIIVSTPIITKQLTKINNSKGDDGIGNYAKGYFLCYIDSDNKLKQIRSDINGETSTVTGPTTVEECTFNLPQNADAYKVTLIGGGGGGAGTKAEKTTAVLARDTIDFGKNNVVLEPFKDYEKYLSRADIWNGIKTLFNAEYTSISIYIEGARPDAQGGKVGGYGAICSFNIGDLISDITNTTSITYSSGQTGTTEDKIIVKKEEETIVYTIRKGNDGIIKTGSKTYYARGGGAPIQYNGAWILYSECYKDIACNKEMGLTYLNYINNLGKGLCNRINITEGSYKPANYTTSTDSIAGDAPYARNNYLNTNINQIPLTLEYNTIKGTIAQTGGIAGNISTHQLAFLTDKTNTTSITIPKGNIGEGGAGGDCITNCEGANGGNTTLSLNLVSGAVTYTAKGGDGGKTTTKTLDYTEVGTVYNADGINGTTISYGIPAVFTSKIAEVTGGTGPIYNAATETKNCDYSSGKLNSKKVEVTGANTNCNGGAGRYAGSGGGSAALAFRLYSGYSPQLKSSLATTFAYPDAGTVIQQYLKGTGGKGAGGAILIEW